MPADWTKGGTAVLDTFKPTSALVRQSVVQFEKEGRPIALGTVIDNQGRVVTKASEVNEGEVSCRLVGGRVVPAQLLAIDEDNDLALFKIEAKGLKPVKWASTTVRLGQWAVTPGIGPVPEAVGVVSAPPRRILGKKAVIGVFPDFSAPTAKVREVRPGLGAEKAGIKAGDIIRSVNGTKVANGEALVEALSKFREGQIVEIEVERGEEELQFRVEMAMDRPERSGRRPDRQERMNRLGGELSRRAEGFQLAFQHDTVLQPWQCGGPVINLEGKAVGLNIARAGRIASYAIPATLVPELIEGLKRDSELPVKQDGRQVR
jgi:serine protease Do